MIVSLLQRIVAILKNLNSGLVKSIALAPTWANDHQYYENDIVFYNGLLWRALIDNIGINPSDESTWEQIYGISDLNSNINELFIYRDYEFNPTIPSGGNVVAVLSNVVGYSCVGCEFIADDSLTSQCLVGVPMYQESLSRWIARIHNTSNAQASGNAKMRFYLKKI